MRKRIRALQTLYTFLYYLILPYLLWRHRRKAKTAPVARGRLAERLGRAPVLSGCIWVHAVSVGETIAAAPLVSGLRTRYPGVPILLTCTTATGSEQARKLFADEVEHVFLPYDLPLLIRRFLKRANPVALIVMETELWPNLLKQCERANVPMVLANARLSSKSFQGYKKIAGLTRSMLNRFALIAAQSQYDAQHFLHLGVEQQRVMIAGNLKFDLHVADAVFAQGRIWQQQLGGRSVVVAGSTHDGEEAILLQAFAQVLDQQPDCLLVLVPRHPNRFGAVEKMCRQQRFSLERKSESRLPKAQTQIYLVDRMGELLACYASAQVAFVGGSLVPVGGHNMLEAAAFSLPILTGPYLGNFLAISEKLQAAQALEIVSDPEQLAAAILALLNNKSKAEQMGKSAQAVLAANIGALDRHLDAIDKIVHHDTKVMMQVSH